MDYTRMISLAKAVAWEQAKGQMRVVAAAAGETHDINDTRWKELKRRIEDFITGIEEDGLHE